MPHQCDSTSDGLPSIVLIIANDDNKDGGLSVTDSTLDINVDSIDNVFHYATVGDMLLDLSDIVIKNLSHGEPPVVTTLFHIYFGSLFFV